MHTLFADRYSVDREVVFVAESSSMTGLMRDMETPVGNS